MTCPYSAQTVCIPEATLDAVLPMHLRLDNAGRIIGAGPTAQKLLPGLGGALSESFEILHPPGEGSVCDLLCLAVEGGERLMLRTRGAWRLSLRGHAARLPSSGFLISLGFGIGLPEAVRRLDLTHGDFAPSELAMELLFLHEANRGVMSELSRFNRQLEEAREEAEVQAHTDALTGLRNRRGLYLALSAALKGARAGDPTGAETGFALAHLDLDHFKEVNDRMGHAAGDEVLRKVARVLREVTRADDTAARVGGDEFVLLLRGVTSFDTLERLGRRIIAEIEHPLDMGGRSCHVSASVGIVVSGSYKSPDEDRLLRDADAASYDSKRAGRGRVTILRAPRSEAPASAVDLDADAGDAAPA